MKCALVALPAQSQITRGRGVAGDLPFTISVGMEEFPCRHAK